jgi:hypothetical protein
MLTASPTTICSNGEVNLDTFWLCVDAEELEAALEDFAAIGEDLKH